MFVESDERRSGCQPGMRCIVRTRLAVSELPNEMVIIPSGGAHAHYYSFRLICGDSPDCARYGISENTLASLEGRPLDVWIAIRLNGDGERTISCRTNPINAEYLRTVGWQTLRCTHSAVRGAHRISLF